MNRPTPRLRSLVKGLMAYETSRRGSSEANAPASLHVIEKLRPHLANVMGRGGFRALLSRALVLAKGDVSWLSATHVTADGTLEGLKAFHSHIDPAEFHDGEITLLAELLALLETFIGPSLALRLIDEIWPRTSLRGRKHRKESSK